MGKRILSDEEMVVLGEALKVTNKSADTVAEGVFPDALLDIDQWKRLYDLTGVVVRLTDEEIKELAEALRDTCLNIYHEAARRYVGRIVLDEDWDRLRALGNVFRCEHCDCWYDLSEESGESDVCDSCNAPDDELPED